MHVDRRHEDDIKVAALSTISASCETFVTLLCDVAHVGFGTYPYDASVSTFGEKLLVLLWRMQQCEKGIKYLGLRTSTHGGGTTLFGALPETAPTSVDEIRRQRREKRPDLAQQMLGHKMNVALPHERALWAKASSPRSPGLGPKAAQLSEKRRKKQQKQQQHRAGGGRAIVPGSGPRTTFGTSPRKSDYEERVKQRRERRLMAQTWDGSPKR